MLYIVLGHPGTLAPTSISEAQTTITGMTILPLEGYDRAGQLDAVLNEMMLKIMMNLNQRGYGTAEILASLDDVCESGIARLRKIQILRTTLDCYDRGERKPGSKASMIINPQPFALGISGTQCCPSEEKVGPGLLAIRPQPDMSPGIVDHD